MTLPEWLSWNTLGWVIAGLTTASIFLEKVFGVTMFGRKIYKGSGTVWKWIMRGAIDRKEMHNKLDKILSEVEINGGKSLKDSVIKNVAKTDALMEMVQDLHIKVDINTTRLDIMDKSNERMTFRLDAQGGCIFVNESFKKQFGHTWEDVKGFNWEDIVHEDDLDEVSEKLKRAIETKGRYHNEQRIYTTNKEIKNCLVVAYPVIRNEILKEFNGTIDIINKN